MEEKMYKPSMMPDLDWVQRDWKANAMIYCITEGIEHLPGDPILFAKEHYLESLAKLFDGAEVKQIMEIPENMAVMITQLNPDDELVCCDSRDTKWPYGLALVKTKRGTVICPIDLVDGKVDVDAQLVSRHKCGKCGREMKILLNPGQDGFEAKYRCESCGRTVKLYSDDTELENKTNE